LKFLFGTLKNQIKNNIKKEKIGRVNEVNASLNPLIIPINNNRKIEFLIKPIPSL
jgi:hypothetical protein